MNAAVETPKKIWTEEEIQALPDYGYIHEIVDGELVISPKNNFFPGLICSRLSMALQAFAIQHRLGLVLDSSTGFWMRNRNCRAPDVSFVTRKRLDELKFKPTSNEFFPGAPDLAIEVLSPDNSRTEMTARLKDFFSSGTQLAWLINPESEMTEVCRAPDQRQLVGGPGAELEGEHLLPGFRYPLMNLFKEWDWD
ncbi:MAG TPA: Uma2 family endonuclease [Candidatus Acidoferrum sp.]|nr:Uma2 family endonuclease [Candidatus Acidoferrum sp.]